MGVGRGLGSSLSMDKKCQEIKSYMLHVSYEASSIVV